MERKSFLGDFITIHTIMVRNEKQTPWCFVDASTQRNLMIEWRHRAISPQCTESIFPTTPIIGEIDPREMWELWDVNLLSSGCPLCDASHFAVTWLDASLAGWPATYVYVAAQVGGDGASEMIDYIIGCYHSSPSLQALVSARLFLCRFDRFRPITSLIYCRIPINSAPSCTKRNQAGHTTYILQHTFYLLSFL